MARDHAESCLLLALPGADHQRPQHGRSGKRAASRSSAASARGGAASAVTPCASAAGSTLRKTPSMYDAASGERLDTAGDVGAVRSADAGLRRTAAGAGCQRGLRRPPHRTRRHTRSSSSTQPAGQRAHAAQVVVLHEQVPARGDRVPQPRQHVDALGQVEQQQPREDEVVRRARDRPSAVRSCARKGTDGGPRRAASPASWRRAQGPRRCPARGPPARPARPSARIVSPGPQPASRQLAPGPRPTWSSSRPVATSHARACIRSRSYSSGVCPSA